MKDKNMSEISVFKNEEFGELRVVEIDGEPWFVGKDVAEVLGYSNTPKAIRDHIDDDDKLTERIVLSGQNREVVCINESGLYSLILSSKLPSAKKFKRWVTSEVLPSIRKNGAYMTKETLEKALTSPDFLIQLAQKLKEEQEKIEELKNENDVLADKVLEMDARTMLNKVIRRYAGVMHCDIGVAWGRLRSEMVSVLGINILNRKKIKGEKSTLDRLSNVEIVNVAKLAIAMCEKSGVRTGDIVPRCKELNPA